MKRYMLSILPLFLALCLMAGCGGRSGMHSRLAAVDSIVDSHYDSALVVLRDMDSLPMRRSDRMYMELLRAKAMNKASVPFTTDSVMRQVARYYDRRGSRNQRLLAHYLLGCTYRDLGSAPRALEEYQRAVSQADTTRADCDLPTLMRVHSQMSNLYMMMRLSGAALREDSIASQICQRMGDVQSALSFKQDACAVLYQEGKYEECIQAAQALYDEYVSHGLKDNAALVYIHSVRSCIALKDFPKAKYYLDNYEQSTHVRGDSRNISGRLAPYYICRGNCFLGLGMPDSAEVYFRKATKDMHAMNNESAVNNGLLHTYILKHETDSICKYADLANDHIMQDFNATEADATIRAKSLYDYGVERQIAEEKSQKLHRLYTFFAFAVLAMLLLISYFLRRDEKKRRRIIELNQAIALAKENLYVAEELQHAALNAQQDNQQQLENAENTIQEQSELITGLRKKLEKLTSVKANQDISNSPIILQLHNVLKMPSTKNISTIRWQDLKTTIEEACPSFFQVVNKNNMLSLLEYRMCLLVKAGFVPSDIEILMGIGRKSSAVYRKRLLKKVFNEEGGAKDFDRLIREIQ